MARVKVKVAAKIKIRFGSVRLAEAVVSAISPDNKPVPRGLKVKTWRERRKLLGVIRCSKGIEAFLSTVDDLLTSVQIAEKTVEMI